MRSYDFSPLFRSSIGFDRVSRLLESAQGSDDVSYPPYNIEKLGENAYRLTMAVAGFGEGDIDITAQDNTLTVKGKAQPEPEGTQFLHRGIAGRAFERRFQLADHVEVDAARLVNGLLHIELVRRVPEALKPRKIEVTAAASSQPTIEQKKAA
ncbi:MAG TPA: Hsp20 family protein [Alphaproteobacteria bacterium]|jgi:molecular chaperone IbpA|nr:Hsp20 family protein [Alphaproteobacteria bacterium]